MKKYLQNLSKTSIMHYLKLAVRTSFFLLALIIYFTKNTDTALATKILPLIVWVWYFAEMLLRMVPWDMESMGCEKVFSKNYREAKTDLEPKRQPASATFTVALSWFVLNGAIFALYLAGIIDKWLLAIIALAYGVCDIVCILFFCPFQTWFMKNRCCTTCRIYNWDFAMLFTPFLLIPSVYTYTLLGFALIILIRWEVTYKRHPERFSERTNESLRCKNCTEKLCRHKVQLKNYISKHRDILFEKLEPALERIEREGEPIAEKYEEISEGLIDTAQLALETAKNVYEKTKETTEKIVDQTKATATKVIDKTKETTEKIKDKTKETAEKIKDKTKETGERAIEKTKEAASKVIDKTKSTFSKYIPLNKMEEKTEKNAEISEVSPSNPDKRAEDSSPDLEADKKIEDSSPDLEEHSEDFAIVSSQFPDSILQKEKDDSSINSD